MGKIAEGIEKINFTMLHGTYCYIFIEKFPQKFSPCTVFLSFASSMDENMKKWPQTETGSQTGAFTLHRDRTFQLI